MIARPLRIAALTCLSLLPLKAMAGTYPMTVTDEAGRQVTLSAEPQRIVLQDGRDALVLALLDRADPFRRVVTWNNLLKRDDLSGWPVFTGKWPAADKIPDMGFGDDGEVNVEEILAARPDLVVVEARALKTMQDSGSLGQLAARHIPVLAIDTFDHPVPDAVNSVKLLGKVLNDEGEADAYAAFYDRHLAALKDTIAKAGTHPKVFMEVLAGRQGADQCCFTHADAGWGALVTEIGAENVGSDLLSTASGDVTLESVIAAKPDVYVFTGRNAGGRSQMVPLGYNADPKAVATALGRFEARPAETAVKAVAEGHAHALWHFFYSHPYNIVAMEYLAKWAYPQSFPDLDPAATWHQIITQFTDIPDAPVMLAADAPMPGK